MAVQQHYRTEKREVASNRQTGTLASVIFLISVCCV